MEIIVLQENLIKTIQEATRFVAQKTQLPVLSGIYLQAGEGEIVIRSTDTKISFETKIGAKVLETGDIVVPAKIITDFIVSLSPGSVTLKTQDQYLLVSQGKLKAKIPIFTGQDFPLFPESAEKFLTLPLDEFIKQLKEVLFAASLDETRPVLSSVLVQISSEQVTMVSTDGYRLALSRKEIESDFEELEVLLSVKSLQELFYVCTRAVGQTIGLAVSKELSQAYFKLGDTLIFLRLIEGKFPPYEQVVPKDFLFSCVFEREGWIGAMKTALIFAKESSSIVTLKFKEQECFVSASGTGAGELDLSLGIKRNKGDGDFSISFNGKFIIDALLHLEEKYVIFSMNDETKPGVIQSEKSQYPLCVVMPFKK